MFCSMTDYREELRSMVVVPFVLNVFIFDEKRVFGPHRHAPAGCETAVLTHVST